MRTLSPWAGPTSRRGTWLSARPTAGGRRGRPGSRRCRRPPTPRNARSGSGTRPCTPRPTRCYTHPQESPDGKKKKRHLRLKHLRWRPIARLLKNLGVCNRRFIRFNYIFSDYFGPIVSIPLPDSQAKFLSRPNNEKLPPAIVWPSLTCQTRPINSDFYFAPEASSRYCIRFFTQTPDASGNGTPALFTSLKNLGKIAKIFTI